MHRPLCTYVFPSSVLLWQDQGWVCHAASLGFSLVRVGSGTLPHVANYSCQPLHHLESVLRMALPKPGSRVRSQGWKCFLPSLYSVIGIARHMYVRFVSRMLIILLWSVSPLQSPMLQLLSPVLVPSLSQCFTFYSSSF